MSYPKLRLESLIKYYLQVEVKDLGGYKWDRVVITLSTRDKTLLTYWPVVIRLQE